MKVEGSKEVKSSVLRSETAKVNVQKEEMFDFKLTEDDQNMGLKVQQTTGDNFTKVIKDKNGKVVKQIDLADSICACVTEYDKQERPVKYYHYMLKDGRAEDKSIKTVDLKNYDLQFYEDTKYNASGNKQTTRYNPDNKVNIYESFEKINGEYHSKEKVFYNEKDQVSYHMKFEYDKTGKCVKTDDLTQNYSAQAIGRMKVFHDNRGRITKTIERVTRGCLLVEEFKEGKVTEKFYIPKKDVPYKEPDLANINWNNYELDNTK